MLRALTDNHYLELETDKEWWKVCPVSREQQDFSWLLKYDAYFILMSVFQFLIIYPQESDILSKAL